MFPQHTTSCVFSASAPLPYWDFDHSIFQHREFCHDMPSKLLPQRCLDSGFGQVHEMKKKKIYWRRLLITILGM
jgi:hypothetical protein